MKRILVLSLLVAPLALANNSNSISRTESDKRPLTAEQVRDRLRLKGEVFVTDASGEKILFSAGEERDWKIGKKGTLLSNWDYEWKNVGKFSVAHEWSVSDDGKIHVAFREYESMKPKGGDSRDMVYGKLLREEKVVLKGFSPLTFSFAGQKNTLLNIRLTPTLEAEDEVLDLKGVPLMLRGASVFDDKGRLWAASVDAGSRFTAFTMLHGQIALSYEKFPGAKEFGYVEGNRVVVKAEDGTKITFNNSFPLLDTGKRALLYGFVRSDKKTDDVNSVRQSDSSRIEAFLKHL